MYNIEYIITENFTIPTETHPIFNIVDALTFATHLHDLPYNSLSSIIPF